MNGLKILISIITLSVGYVATLSAQYKYEVESRIKTEEVPSRAREFIDRCGFRDKIKWYKEKSNEGKSYEAKSKRRNIPFSIEFDTLGNVLDVERTVPFESLDETLKKTIRKNFDSLFVAYNIRKTQIKWQGEEDVLITLITTGSTEKSYVLGYEIELKAKKENFSKFYQVLFDHSGEVLEVLEIIQSRTENLEF
jgi:hypothetical protein